MQKTAVGCPVLYIFMHESFKTQTSISLLTASRFVAMAENSASVAKMARLLAINQIVIGFLLFSFGIADRLVPGSFTGYVYSGVWIGIWVSKIIFLLKMIILLLC